MVGVLELTQGRGRARLERWSLLGLELPRVRTPVPAGLGGARLARRVDWGAKLLAKAGVRRVLTAAGFPCRDVLARRGLEPVDPGPFCRFLAAPLVLAALEKLGVAPERASVSLWAPVVSPTLLRAAEALCPRVRLLSVDVPRERDALAAWLWREFGAAVPAPGRRAHAAVWFAAGGGEGEAVLRLYGPAPDLAGLALTPPAALVETGLDPLSAMALLWEAGRLDGQKIAISSTAQT